MEAAHQSTTQSSPVPITNELILEKNEQGQKVYNGKYVALRTIASNTLCKLVEAAVLRVGGDTAVSEKRVCLKIWKKQVLRSRKEYHRRKDGHGMYSTDELMKVRNSEVRAMLRLAESGQNHSQNVVRLLEIIDDEGFEDKLVLVMEFCPGGQLLNWSSETHAFSANLQSQKIDSDGNFSEATIRDVLRDVSKGLLFCHQHGVLHRDIKPQNIIFGEDQRAKLIDFGVSMVLDDLNAPDTVSQTQGTYHFMPPEACDPDIDNYSAKAADVWSLGVTLFTLLFKKCPFWGSTEYQLMESIRNDDLHIPQDSTRQVVSAELMQLLLAMLTKDPSQRITLQALIATPYLKAE